jgi:hypothetical protein
MMAFEILVLPICFTILILFAYRIGIRDGKKIAANGPPNGSTNNDDKKAHNL